jgi:hypothetical protein
MSAGADIIVLWEDRREAETMVAFKCPQVANQTDNGLLVPFEKGDVAEIRLLEPRIQRTRVHLNASHQTETYCNRDPRRVR